jgi:hypothetical protein
VSTIDWNHPRSWDEVCRRHAARRRWNAVRRVAAEDRRRRVLELVRALGGLERGAQSRIAAALGVHRSTISKDLRRLLRLAPAQIVARHLPDESLQLPRDGWPASSGGPAPQHAEPLTAPRCKRLWLRYGQGVLPVTPPRPPDQGEPYRRRGTLRGDAVVLIQGELLA